MHREAFKAPDFTGASDIESFIQQFLPTANEWPTTATLLYIHMHLKDGAHECESYPTLDEVLEALRFKCGLIVLEARTRLANLRRDTKLSLADYATETKRL